MISEDELDSKIKDWIMQHGQTRQGTYVDETIDLIASGTLDSMGFIELLVYIEFLTGRKIDLHDLDPSVFTSIQGLVRNVCMVNSYA